MPLLCECSPQKSFANDTANLIGVRVIASEPPCKPSDQLAIGVEAKDFKPHLASLARPFPIAQERMSLRSGAHFQVPPNPARVRTINRFVPSCSTSPFPLHT